MPGGRPSQGGMMLYTVLTFVGLFLVAAVFAVFFYVKSEDYKVQRDDMAVELGKLANDREVRELSKTVGKPLARETILGTMLTYLDEMVSAITGEFVEGATASVRVNGAKMQINETVELLGDDASGTYGPDGFDLLQTIRSLKSELDTARAAARSMEALLNETHKNIDVAQENWRLEERRLIEEKSRFQAMADEIQGKYDQLKALMQESVNDQVKIYMDRLQVAEDKLKQKNKELLKLQTQSAKTDEALQDALSRLEKIKPRPDTEVEAYNPDARIVDIDRQTDVVYLDIGSSDHVYRGLTFSVYDKNVPIPENGKSKAEIEVFHVSDTVSAARINTSSKKNPIVHEDIIANLIWDSKKSNVFVVAGRFDFDRDGEIDRDGKEKVERLIERWGGRLAQEVTINTDFVVLGEPPVQMEQPTRQDIELDLMIDQRYQESVASAEQYNEILRRANTLRVPIFNQSRFMYLIGYDSLARTSSPF
ncbi:MAG TPA: hypothetical protein HPP87_05065 [Planctomycetes bacterium]|nr:hypothetical protein [Planctomycetota bacterium]